MGLIEKIRPSPSGGSTEQPEFDPNGDFVNVLFSDDEVDSDIVEPKRSVLPHAAAAFSPLLAVGTVAARIFYGSPFLTLGTGFFLQWSVQLLAPESAVAREQDLLLKYASIYYITALEIFFNIASNPIITTSLLGSFNVLLGMQLATMTHATFHRKQEHDHFLTVDETGSSKEKISTLWGRSLKSRHLMDLAKVGLGLAGVFYPGYPAARKLGLILLGHAGGCSLYECVHGVKVRLQLKDAQNKKTDIVSVEEQMSPSYKAFIRLERIVYIAATLLVGPVLAFNRWPADLTAGICMGIMRQVQWIQYTQTPFKDLQSLRFRVAHTHKVATVAKWAFALLFEGFIAYAVTQSILNKDYKVIAPLGTVMTLLPTVYAFSRWIGKQQIPKGSLLNTIFFFTNFSIAPPVIYVAIKQVMKTGDLALQGYGPYKLALASMSYASLAYSFATLMGMRANGRNHPFPAEVDPLSILLTSQFVNQVMRYYG